MAKNKNTTTTRNTDSTLFKQLTRVFSGPIVNRRTQTYKRLRTQQMDKYGRKFRSVSGQAFRKTAYDPSTLLQSERIVNYNRAERYKEFNQYEYVSETSAALTIYANEITTSTSLSPVLKIDCPNEEIKIVLEALYYNILNVEENLFWWARSMCKYGDFFLYLDIVENEGVTSVIGLPPAEIEILEGEDETNLDYIQYQWNARGLTFENWQVAHFRNLADDRFSPYGTSIMDPVRRWVRALIMLEDHMMSYRVVRSSERRVYYIDVGDIDANDVEQYMERILTSLKRHTIVDQSAPGQSNFSGMDLRMNPWNVEEDIFIPVRSGTQTKVDQLPAGRLTTDIDDIKYMRDKVLTGLNIPFSYLSRDDTGESSETLTQKDVQFASHIQRLQKPVVAEMEKIGQIHLITLGYKDEDIVSFRLSLNNPSKIAELQMLEEWRTKIELAQMALEGPFSYRWTTQNILALSEDEALRIKREKYHDAKYEALITGIREGAMNADMGMPGEEGDLLGLGDGEADLDAEMPGGEDEMGLDSGDEIPTDGENSLLVTPPGEAGPGKRDEYTTPGAKGKMYKRATTDKRKGFGPRKKNYAGQLSQEKGRNTKRTITPGINRTQVTPRVAHGLYESELDDEMEIILDGMFTPDQKKGTQNYNRIETSFKDDYAKTKKMLTEINNALKKGTIQKITSGKEKDETNQT